MVRRAGLSDHSAEDVVQEAFTAAWQALPTMREPDRFDAWLSTTCRRMAQRRRGLDRRDGASLSPESANAIESGDDPAHALELDEDRLLVRGALAQLTHKCQLLLRALMQLAASSRREGHADYEAVSRLTGMPTGSIGPTRQRCLDALASKLLRFGLRVSKPT